MELFVGPSRHHPFDIDGTIPSNHLRNFEHSLISMFLFAYAFLAIVLDKHLKAHNNIRLSLTQLVGAAAFGQELLLFRLHSTDHHGLEGQYHMLLQLLVVVSFATTLLGIGLPNSFLVSFVRSASIVFQGVWFILTGYMLWTPALMPKGCFIYNDDGHKIVNCSEAEALHRAKSLVNIEFSWFFMAMTIFSIAFYLGVFELYSKRATYSPLPNESSEKLEAEDSNDDDIEFQKKQIKETFGGMGAGVKGLDIKGYKN